MITKEQDHIQQFLYANSYPKGFVKKHLTQEKRTKEDEGESKGFVILPYIQNVSEKISRILTSYKIKTCMKPHQTLRNVLSRPKDPVEKKHQTGVVYSIPCLDCDVKYVGETKRSLKTREKEHMAALRLHHPQKSALAEHALNTGHSIDWTNISIIHKETRWHQRKWLEAIEIAKHQNVLFNRDSGRTLPDSYSSIIKKS